MAVVVEIETTVIHIYYRCSDSLVVSVVIKSNYRNNLLIIFLRIKLV